ncbi:MAG: hypothetical protein R3F14_10620 [Polyangiaceae bacterium]
MQSDPMGTATVAGRPPFQLPDVVQVEEGKTVSIEITRAPATSLTVEIDGKKTKENLQAHPRPQGRHRRRPRALPAPPTGGRCRSWAKPKK